jgi:outer membrane protein assembly factor BamA
LSRKFAYTIGFCLLSLFVFSQESVILNLSRVDGDGLPKKYKISDTYNSQTKLDIALEELVYKLRKSGYVTASLDTLLCDSIGCQAKVFVGQQFIIQRLENGNVSDEVWKKLGLAKSGSSISLNLLDKIEKEVLKHHENNGYPYAQVWVDSFELLGNGAKMTLFVDEKEAITIDSVVVHGDTKTKSRFLQRYLGIASGDDYSQQKLNSISQKLKQLSYLRTTKPAEVYFTPGKAEVHVFLEKQKSNQFNLILGVLPNTELVDKKVTITGDGKLQLLNSFGVGEEIYAEFRQLKPRTQNLDIAFAYPYLLNSPIGVFGDFNLYKNDSLFIDINTEVGLLYQFGGFNRLKFFYDNQSSNILNVDSLAIKSSGILPTTLDIRNNSYGLALELQQLDYVLNPRKGFQLEWSGGVGLNKIKVNQSIASLIGFDGEPLQNKYDSLALKKINYALGFHLSQFIPIRKRGTFLLRNVSKLYIAKNILNNEKYRIGGYRLLRGFDEEAIYTPYYSIFTSEFRFLLSQNSFFNVFADIAIVEDEQKGPGNIDVPIGFGMGVALQTRGGIFSLSYALGKNLDNKIEFRNGKIHFGFISLF